MPRIVRATRYVTPLREGGSLPAIIEADDDGLYVLKFRGAGQGALALVAELVAGEIGRALGLRIPELVLVELDIEMGRNEPDQEIQDLLKASVGLNLALDYLPGSVMFDPAAGDTAVARIASLAICFDAFVLNVDRTASNPNLLLWHRQLHFIDHGAAMYFHHNWEGAEALAASPFSAIAKHVLLPWATEIEGAADELRGKLSEEGLEEILRSIPEDWLIHGASRERYLEFFSKRLEARPVFVEEAMRARTQLV